MAAHSVVPNVDDVPEHLLQAVVGNLLQRRLEAYGSAPLRLRLARVDVLARPGMDILAAEMIGDDGIAARRPRGPYQPPFVPGPQPLESLIDMNDRRADQYEVYGIAMRERLEEAYVPPVGEAFAELPQALAVTRQDGRLGVPPRLSDDGAVVAHGHHWLDMRDEGRQDHQRSPYLATILLRSPSEALRRPAGAPSLRTRRSSPAV